MAENLFQKYRPLNFKDVFGHTKVLKELQQRAKENNFPHVMLFSGYTGTGKTTLEKIVSKSIQCQHKDVEGNACNKCEFCLTIQNEKPSNYYYLYNASNIGIDEMREIEISASMKAMTNAKYKVFVIDELQELGSNQKAMKAILKVLEKPSSYTYFILLTMDESKVNSAIKNRCVPYKLRPLDYTDIAKYLYSICKSENVLIDTKEKMETLTTIAGNANGSMRTAVSYLERCIYSDIWNKDEILKELSIISQENLVSIMNMILQGNVQVMNAIDPTKDFVDKLRYAFAMLLKFKSGVEMTPYQVGMVKGVVKTDINDVFKIMETFNTLIQFPYLNAEIIETAFIKMVYKPVIAKIQPTPIEEGEKRTLEEHTTYIEQEKERIQRRKAKVQ